MTLHQNRLCLPRDPDQRVLEPRLWRKRSQDRHGDFICWWYGVFPQEEPYTMSKGSEWEGYCVDLLAQLSQRLGFKYNLKLVKDGRYGSVDSSGNWNGMIGEIISGVSHWPCSYATLFTPPKNNPAPCSWRLWNERGLWPREEKKTIPNIFFSDFFFFVIARLELKCWD